MLAWLDNHAAPAKALINPFAAIPIRANTINLIRTKQGAELFDRLLGAKWWAYFAHCIEHAAHTLFMRNRQREAIAGTTRRVSEGAVDVAPVIRPLSNAGIDARLNTF